MKLFYHHFFLLIAFFISPNTSFSVIKELSRLQQSLQRITPFLSGTTTKPEISSKIIPTDSRFLEAINDAYKNKSPNLLDKYEQTAAVIAAKSLIEYGLKRNISLLDIGIQIPGIAHIIQQVTEKFSDKSSLNYLSFTSDSTFSNEELLAIALKSVGYKEITLVYINNDIDENGVKSLISKNSHLQEIFEVKKTKDPNKINIIKPYSANLYIGGMAEEGYKKNHLFLMLNPSEIGDYNLSKENLLEKIKFYSWEKGTPNNLQFVFLNKPNINIYLPYAQSDYFVIPDSGEDIDNIRTTINESGSWNQAQIMYELINTYYDSLKALQGSIIQNQLLVFLDLIGHTGDPKNFLAFKGSLSIEGIKPIDNMSGTFEQIYKRYKT